MVILREGLCPGLTSDILSVLRTNHIKTVVDLVASDLEELARKCSLSYKTLVAVRRVLLAQYSAFPLNGADLYEELKVSTAILPTGNMKLDVLLDSGLYTGEVTEIAGAAGSGKTQLCQSIAVNVVTSLKQKVCYVDTTGGLTATRLLQMIQSRTKQEDEQISSLQKIEVIRVFDAYKLLDVLQDLRHSFPQQTDLRSSGIFSLVYKPELTVIHLFDKVLDKVQALYEAEQARCGEALKLVVIDSVCAVIYPLMGGKQIEGMAIMMHLAQELKSLARDFNISVLVTNYITKNGATVFRPALGRSWSFVPSTRIMLNRPEGNSRSGHRSISLTKSPRQPTNLQVELEIGSCGTLDKSL